ncbi:MAG: hypothetical protein ABJB39_01755 [Chloroflexota bacterium]
MNRKTRRSRIRAIAGADDGHTRHDEEAARLEKSLADLPGVAGAYENYVRVRGPGWGSERTLRAYDAFNQVLWPYLERLLMDGGPEDELQRAFDFVERVASSSEFARGIVATELGWELWARRHSRPNAELSRAAERYMGPKTATVFLSQEALVRSIDETRWSNRLRRWLRSRVTPKDPKSSA